MQEPVLSVRGIHPGTLVRSVDRRISLMQDDFLFPGTVNIFRTQYGLPAGLHAPCRSEDIVIAVSLVQLRSLDGGLGRMAIIDELTVIQHSGAVRFDGRHIQHALETDTASGESCHHVCFAVLIPERTGIDPSHYLTHISRLAPLAERIRGLAHHDALVRHGDKYVISSLMITDGRCPGTTAVYRLVIIVKGKLVNDVIDDLPVHQILRMQQRHCRGVTEAGSDHKIILSHTNGIRVRIIGIQDRVGIGAVALISDPHFMYLGLVHNFSIPQPLPPFIYECRCSTLI